MENNSPSFANAQQQQRATATSLSIVPPESPAREKSPREVTTNGSSPTKVAHAESLNSNVSSGFSRMSPLGSAPPENNNLNNSARTSLGGSSKASKGSADIEDTTPTIDGNDIYGELWKRGDGIIVE